MLAAIASNATGGCTGSCTFILLSNFNGGQTQQCECRLFVLTLCLAGNGGPKYCFVATALAQTQNWEPSIRRFEEQDKINPPKLGCIVFTGSSSIARWETLVDEMKPLDVINRGFGGSQYSDLNQYAKRIVIAYQPRAVVVYEGDNDRAAGSSKTPESVANDARVFVQTIHFGVTGNL